MTNTEIATKIGLFEMKPEVDICKDCPRCDLEMQTREFHYVDKPKGMEVRGICKHADICRGTFEYCMRNRGVE